MVGLPLLGGEIDEELAGRGGDYPQLWGHRRGGAAAKRAHVEGGQPGVGHHQLNGRDRGSQLLRHDLGEGGADVLPHLYLARVDSDLAVLADVQPGADILRSARTSAAATTTPSPRLL